MVQVPTNYKMGTGLAATIYGQQAGLEAEQQGLANLTKAMQMPGEALKGQEAAALMQDPNYLQQKTANTIIELGNQYDAGAFQQTLNAANRVRIQLDAAGGDKAKEQQIVMQALGALKMDPNSEFGQYAMRDPRGALDKFIQGTEVAMSRSAKQIGAESLQNKKLAAEMDMLKLKEVGDDRRARLSANTQASSADRAYSAQALGSYDKIINAQESALKSILTSQDKNAVAREVFEMPEASDSEINTQIKRLQGELKDNKKRRDYVLSQNPLMKNFKPDATPAPDASTSTIKYDAQGNRIQ